MKNVDDDIDAALAVEMASLKGNHDDYYDDNDNTNEGIMNSRTANKYQNTNDANPNIAQVCGSNLAALVRAYLTYIRVHQPGMFWTIACLLLLVPTTLLILDLVDNPLEEFGVIAHDYSTINLQSNFDHTMKDIDHWCLKGDNDSCRCEDPTLPAPRNEFRRWSNAHAGNVAMIEDLLTQGVSEPDIAFLGGTVVEKMGELDSYPVSSKSLFMYLVFLFCYSHTVIDIICCFVYRRTMVRGYFLTGIESSGGYLYDPFWGWRR